MARFLVEVLVTAAGEAQVTGVADNIGAAFGRSSKSVDQSSLRSEAALRRTAEAAAKLKEQFAETNKSKSFIADMDALNKKLKEQADHWKRGEVGIAAWAEKEKQAAEAQRILTAQVRAGVSADSEHGKQIANLIRQHNTYQKELDETKRREAERLGKKLGAGGISGDPLAAVLGSLGPIGGQALGSAQQILYLKGAIDVLKESGKGAVQALTQMLAGLGPLGGLAIGAAAGVFVLKQAWDVTFGAALSYLKDVIIEGAETQGMIEQLNATLRSNGSYSGLSARGMIDLAESLALLSGGMDDPIIKAETIISRFDRIGSDIFPRVVTAAVNMSRALGKSMEDSAESISRLLSGTQGLRGAREAGIILDPAQKKYLENLIEQNKLTEYQNILLDILEQKLGDAAEAFGNTLPGAVGRTNFVYGEFREEIANQVIPALEDVFREIILQADGWENVKDVVTSAGREIGDAIRVMVYAAAILFEKWAASADGLRAALLGSFAAIIDGVSRTAGVLAAMPSPQSNLFRAAELAAGKAASDLGKRQEEAGRSALRHAGSVVRLTRDLAAHRTALEGSTEVYTGLGTEIERTNRKMAEQADLAKELIRISNERQEKARYLSELNTLAETRGLSLGERIVQEARINREHEYRVKLLKAQAQFGDQIGTALAKQEQMLEDLDTAVNIKLKIALLPSIKMDSTIVKQFDQSMKDFLVTFARSEEIARDNAAAFAAVGQAQEEWPQDFADSWRDSLKTVRERFEDEIKAIENAVALGPDAGGLTPQEGEEALARTRSEMLAHHLSEWGSFFSTLGGMFGGLLQKIGNAINAIAQGQQLGTQAGDAMGLSSGATAAAGYMGATVAIFAEIYKEVSAHLKREKARTWGDVTSVSVVDGKMSSPPYFNQAGREISTALRDMINQIVDTLDAVLDDLPDIVIRARKDGKEFSAYVAGVFVGTFRDAQDALEAAVSEAIKQADFTSISAEFVTVLKNSVGASLDELERNIEVARTARRARIGDKGEEYIDMADRWRREIDAARALGLAVSDMIDARRREVDALKHATLGIDTTISDQLRALGSLDKGIAEAATGTRVVLRQQIDALLAEIDRLSKVGQATPGGQPGQPGTGSAGGTGGGRGIYSESTAESDKIERLRAEIRKLVDELERIPDALSPDELRMGIFDALYKPFEGASNKYSKEAEKWARMRVQIEYELVRLELLRLGMWEEFAQMFNDSLTRALELAGESARGGRRGSGQKQEVRDFIKDRRYDLDTRGLTDFQRQLADLNREYDEQASKVGKNKDLLRDLNKLRADEIALLKDEQRKKVTKSVDEFLGLVTPFDKVRETAADLIKEIEGSPFGNPRKAKEIGRVLAGLEAQIGRMSRQAAVSLFGELLRDMEAAGATEAQMSEARRQMAILEHGLKMAHYAEELTALQLQGSLAPEYLAALQRAFDFLKTIDPTKTPAAPGADTAYRSTASEGINIFEDFEQAKARILEQLDEWNLAPLGELTKKAAEMSTAFDKLMEDVEKLKPMGWDFTGQALEAFAAAKNAFIADIFSSIEEEVGGSPLVRRLHEIGVQFDDIYGALTKLGASQADLAKAEELRLKTVQAALDEWLEPITDYLNESKFGPGSTLTGEQQFFAAQSEFRKLGADFLGGDLSITAEQIAAAAKRYRDLGGDYTAGEGYRFLDKEITDTLTTIRTNLPGLAGIGSSLGSISNPMASLSPDVVASLSNVEGAVNVGNELLLTEARASLAEMRLHTQKLSSIQSALMNTLSVRLVA